MAGGASATAPNILDVDGGYHNIEGVPYPNPTSIESYEVVNVTNNGGIYAGTGAFQDAYEVVSEFNASQGVTYGRVTGAAEFNKITDGTFWVSGTFELTGDLNLDQGWLIFDEQAQYLSSNEIHIASGAVLRIATDANNPFVLNAASVDGEGNISMAHGGTAEIASTLSMNRLSIEGPNGSVTRLTSAAGANTYSVTAIFSGTLVTTADHQLGHGLLQLGNTTPGYAALDLAGTSQTVGGLHLRGGGIIDDTVGGGQLLSIYDSQVVNGTVNVEFAGDVKLTKSGTANDTVVLNAINTYTGPTHVLGGKLQIGAGVGNAIGASTGLYVSTEGDVYNSTPTAANAAAEFDVNGNDIAINGVIELDHGGFLNDSTGGGSLAGVADADGYTFHLRNGDVSVNLTGDGGLRKDSAFTVSLNTANSYTGPTSVNDGVLDLYANNALPTGSDLEVNFDGRVNLNGTSQKISGLHNGVLPDGTHEVNGGIVDLGTAFLAEYGELEVGHDDATSLFSGAVIGSGELVKVGEGTLFLDGVIDISGATAITDGNIHLIENNGLNVIGNVYVGQDGALTGNGRIGGNLWNDGIVSPGNSPGTIVVGGDYIQTHTGSYLVEIDAHKVHDRLLVGGEALLGGNLVVRKDAAYKPYRNDRFRVVRAEGGRDGRFDRFYHNFGNTMLRPVIDYKAKSAWVVVEQRKFAELAGLTHNQRQVAKALDHAAPRNQIDKAFEHLNYTDVSNVPSLLSEISPEQLTSIFSISVATSQIQNVNIERRLDDVRNGASGFSSNGLALNSQNGNIRYDGTPIANTADGLTLAGWDGNSIVGKEVIAPVATESRWGVFATGHGEWANIKGTNNAAGQEFTSAGFTIGADYRVSENFVVGVQGGYTNTQSDLLRGGHLEVDGGRGGVYASWFGNGAYVNAAVGGGYNSYRTKRNTLGGFAHGDSDGGEFNALLGAGYDYTVCSGLTIGPVASLQYTYTGLNNFTENGSDAPLSFPSQHADSLRTLVGAKIAGAINAGSVVIRPEVRAQWKHEYMDSTPGISSRLSGADYVFTVDAPEMGRDSLVLDAGAAVEFNSTVSVFAYYTGELGRKNYDSHSVNGGFRIAF